MTNSDNPNDVGLKTKLDNIQFISVDVSWSAVKYQHGALVVVDGVTPIPADLIYSQIDKIYFLNGRDLAFSIINIK